MLTLPQLTQTVQNRDVTDTFGGYNHNLKIAEGEWYDEENLSSADYPLFSPRDKRRIYHTGLTAPGGMISKDALAWVDDGKLYYNGLQIDGITLTAGEKQMVGMGAYICIFPDGVYLNTKDLTDKGSMGAKFTTVGSTQLAMCDIDGEVYSSYTAAPTAPASPANGDYWIDTSSTPHALKQYSSTSAMWIDVPTVYTKITATGIGKLFKTDDGVTLSGLAYGDAGTAIHDQVAALNMDAILYGQDDDYIIVVGIIDQAVTLTAPVTVERKIPQMDYVCEANNRLWGCKYGAVDGVTLNEIYACKLGDFKNWHCFMGLSTDSYTVSLGADGPFTGAIAYQGYPTFFRENYVHRIYGTVPSSFQVKTTACRGVQAGSWRSLAIVNEVLFYKSRTDVCAYSGNMPSGISQQLGSDLYYNASAGSWAGFYYISMQHADGSWHLFVYDSLRGVWHREDGLEAAYFCAWDDSLFCVDAGGKRILDLRGRVGDGAEDEVAWRAESGLIGYELVDKEYVSRFNFRMKMPAGSSVTMHLEYDSDGEWHLQGRMAAPKTGTFTIPVIPRRCDHFRIRLAGVGDVKIYSMAKIIETGSDMNDRYPV